MTLILSLVIFILIMAVLFLSFMTRRVKTLKNAYLKALENSDAAVCITDPDARIEYVNAAFISVTGYTAGEAVGRDAGFMKSGRHSSSFYEEMWKSLADTGRWEGEIWDRKKSGEVYPKWLTISSVTDRRGRTIKYIGSFADMTSIKQTEEQIEHLTHYDSLTGLPNRLLFRERISLAMRESRRRKNLAVLYCLDINQMERINAALGYAAGDQLLKDMAGRLEDGLLENDTAAYLGSDSFGLLKSGLKSEGDAVLSAQKILEEAGRPFMLKNSYEVAVTAGMGCAIYPQDADTVDELIRNSQAAMRRAKEAGGNSYYFFKPEMMEKPYEQLSIEANLRHAFDQGEFLLYYQPIIDLREGRTTAVEALIRRKEPDWIAPPSSFIKVAEKAGLIRKICEWTLLSSCREVSKWVQQGKFPPVCLSVNVTASQFYDSRLAAMIEQTLQETALPPGLLELELTERIIMHDTEASLNMMYDLKKMGIRLLIDDFGTGYSSLSYLKKFPVDKLKIDISFVRGLPEDSDSASIVRAIIGLGHNLNLRVLAEGVEKKEQMVFLRDLGCDEIQGFYFSRPLPADMVENFILEQGHIDI